MIKKRPVFYQMIKDEHTGGIRLFDTSGDEIKKEQVLELINGLTTAYLDISEEEYVDRTSKQIEYNIECTFEEYGKNMLVEKHFRKDLKKNWSFKCQHCLEKVSSKTKLSYWIPNTFSLLPKGFIGNFCSKECGTIYLNEIKRNQINKKKLEYGLRRY